MYKYNFPEICLKSTHTLLKQIKKVKEEVDEANDEMIVHMATGKNSEKVLLECGDTLLAAETLHRMMVSVYGLEKVNLAIKSIIEKNHSRNYFTKEVI